VLVCLNGALRHLAAPSGRVPSLRDAKPRPMAFVRARVAVAGDDTRASVKRGARESAAIRRSVSVSLLEGVGRASLRSMPRTDVPACLSTGKEGCRWLMTVWRLAARVGGCGRHRLPDEGSLGGG
jgi:hypothetical protein